MSDAITNESVASPRAVARDLFSATIGSVCCCYTGQPLDTIKVRMQTNPLLYPSVVPSISSIFKQEGVLAFWKGAVPTALGMAAENCMAFGVNEALKRAFPNDLDASAASGPPSMAKPFCMGALTGCCSALVLLPSEVLKAKLQVVVGDSVTARQTWNKMYASRGMRSLFVGLDAQLARDSAFYAVFFGSYELSCYMFRTYAPSMPEELNFFVSGGLAGVFGWCVAMPLDVPKTNVQSRYDTKVIGSYLPELVSIARVRGISGLYSGLMPTVIRAFPANAALFLGVEMGKRAFDNLF
ncbi:hypothetical protein MPSEU_000868700 [Mayamaea pseudoterrestris]|nr:hypothetical protein MPSEU_000868700 [Mayamaea pseudoterrestris]